MTMETIRVAFAEQNTARNYDILIGQGLLAQAGERIAALLPCHRVAIVTDNMVAAHYLAPLEQALTKANISHCSKILPAGEGTKTYAQLETLTHFLLEQKIERNDILIALGGGVIGDLAGFAAAILRRGMAFVQIPTSLLAQIDSAIGGKTGINTPHGKNLIGAFHQPALVLADIDLLASLPDRQLRAGYAEIIKYAAIADKDFFTWLEAHSQALLARDPQTLITAISHSCATKAAIVTQDEREQGKRALLNLGHTFGHAYETVTHYSDRLLHGEAVALGMCLAFQFSVRLNLCPQADCERFCAHIKSAGLPSNPHEIDGAPFDANMLMDIMAQDKKARDGVIRLVLTRGIGEAFVHEQIDEAELRAFMQTQTDNKHKGC